MAPPSNINSSASSAEQPATFFEKIVLLRAAGVLKSRLVIICCVLSLITVVVSVKSISDLVDLVNVNATTSSLRSSDIRPQNVTNAPPSPNSNLTIRLIVLFGTLTICLGSMIYLVVSRVVMPLRTFIDTLNEMAQGNLDIVAPSHYGDEMGDLGCAINNLAINFQEVLLLTGTAVGNSHNALEHIEKTLDKAEIVNSVESDLKEQITTLKKDLRMLGTVVKSFNFFQTRFDGRKVISQDPGGDI